MSDTKGQKNAWDALREENERLKTENLLWQESHTLLKMDYNNARAALDERGDEVTRDEFAKLLERGPLIQALAAFDALQAERDALEAEIQRVMLERDEALAAMNADVADVVLAKCAAEAEVERWQRQTADSAALVESLHRTLDEAKVERWNEGVEATIERLREYWDDGPQGNAYEAAELVMLRDLLIPTMRAKP